MRTRYLLWRLTHPIGGFFGDDWNHWWAEKFDNYSILPGKVDTLFEFGCGRYTNARIILGHVQAARVYLSDPLMTTYLSFRSTWLTNQYKARKIMCDSSPLEECPFADQVGDVVILINVLDHVQDGIAGLQKSVDVLKVGGWFVFGQDLTNREDKIWTREDLGHPIRFNAEQLDEILHNHFDLAMSRRILPRHLGRLPDCHYGTYLVLGQRVR